MVCYTFALEIATHESYNVDDFKRILSCMVTCHLYSMYYTSPAITIQNTEMPLPSLLVTSWRWVCQPKMRRLFGKDVTLARSSNIQSPNEGKISLLSVTKNATRNRKTPGSNLSP